MCTTTSWSGSSGWRAKSGHEHERPYAAYWSLRGAVVAFRAVDNPMKQHPIAAIDDDGRWSGGSQVDLRRSSTTLHLAYGEPIVRPATAAAERVPHCSRPRSTYAAEQGRTTYSPRSTCRSRATGQASRAGSRLLCRHGFTTASLELHRVLDLPGRPRTARAVGRRHGEQARRLRLVPFGDRPFPTIWWPATATCKRPSTPRRRSATSTSSPRCGTRTGCARTRSTFAPPGSSTSAAWPRSRPTARWQR